MSLFFLAEFTLGAGVLFGVWQVLTVTNWESAASPIPLQD